MRPGNPLRNFRFLWPETWAKLELKSKTQPRNEVLACDQQLLLCTIMYHLHEVLPFVLHCHQGQQKSRCPCLLSCYSLHGSHLQTLQAYKHIYIYIQHLVGGFNVPKKCQCGSSFHFFMELKHVFNHQGSSKHHSIIFHGLRFCSFTVFHRGLVSRTLPCVKAKLNYSRYIKVYELSCNYRYKLYIRLYKYIAELLLL